MITTGTGDKGYTDFKAQRVRKTSDEIELMGAIDEAMSDISLARTYAETIRMRVLLCNENQKLRKMSGYIAGYSNYDARDYDTEEMYMIIESTPTVTEFELCWRSREAAALNVARASVRKVERCFLRYVEKYELENHEDLMIYLNRLSDYLFSLAITTERYYGND